MVDFHPVFRAPLAPTRDETSIANPDGEVFSPRHAFVQWVENGSNHNRYVARAVPTDQPCRLSRFQPTRPPPETELGVTSYLVPDQLTAGAVDQLENRLPIAAGKV